MQARSSRSAPDALHSLFSKSILAAGREHPLVYYSLMGLELEIIWDSVIGQTLESSLEEAIQFALPAPSCGAAANAVGELFCDEAACARLMQNAKLGKFFSVAEFDADIRFAAKKDSFPLLVRISLAEKQQKGFLSCHDYILYITHLSERDELMGYVYQSNIADGMEDNAFSLLAWLQDETKSVEQNLQWHLNDLHHFLRTENDIERAALYEKLYFCRPIVKVEKPADLSQLTHHKAFMCTYTIVPVNVDAALRKITVLTEDGYKKENSLRELLGISWDDNLAEKYMVTFYEKSLVCYKALLAEKIVYESKLQELFRAYTDPGELLSLCEAILKNDTEKSSWSLEARSILDLHKSSLTAAAAIITPDAKVGFFEDIIIDAVNAQLITKKKELRKLNKTKSMGV